MMTDLAPVNSFTPTIRKMQVVMLAYLAILFVVFTPGVFLRLPKGGSKLVVAAVHGVLLALVWHFTRRFLRRLEGFQEDPIAKVADIPASTTSMAAQAEAAQAQAAQAAMPAAPTMLAACVKKDDCSAGHSCLNGVCVHF